MTNPDQNGEKDHDHRCDDKRPGSPFAWALKIFLPAWPDVFGAGKLEIWKLLDFHG